MEQKQINLIFGISLAAGAAYLYRRQAVILNQTSRLADVMEHILDHLYQQHVDEQFLDIAENFDN